MSHKIGLGTVQFGIEYGISNKHGKTSPIDACAVLDQARNNGVDIVDTALAYGDAESVLGNCGVTDMKIVSKFISSPESSVEQQFEKTCALLRVNGLYGYLAHRPLEAIKNAGEWERLVMLRERGLVKKIGFSFNSPHEIDECLSRDMQPDLIQVPFNYFDHRFAKHLVALKNRGCEIHTRSAFLQGLFFVETGALSEFFNPVKPLISELQKKCGKDLPLYLLKYVADREFIDHVIIGVENVKQFQYNLQFNALTSGLDDFDRVIPESILMPMYWPKHS